VNTSLLARWRGSFLTGLAVILPGVLTIAVIKWLFGTIAIFTDSLLFFLPGKWTHQNAAGGPMFWYWSVAAFVMAIALVTLVGLLTRYYIGKRIISWFDTAMLRLPLLNKIYATLKQLNEAFTTSKKTPFKSVVQIEFPGAGSYAVGFTTTDQNEMFVNQAKERLINVFVPTTPFLTSGFLILVPEAKITRLDMSVAEGIKYIISLGAIAPDATSLPGKRG
jgi:uncharacterized membrane protein